MKLAFVSNLFPDAAEPTRGLDNARLLRELSEGQGIPVRVVAPRAHRPFSGPFAARAARAEDAGLGAVFPPYRYLPKVGGGVNHLLYRRAVAPVLERLREEFDFNAILCSWTFPDTCAVVPLAARWRVPTVAVVQGSDAHIYLRMPVRGRLIPRALRRASAVVARSGALRELLVGAGVPAGRVHTVYNGVDLDCFHPGDPVSERAALGLPGVDQAALVLYLGNFYPIKNPALAVRALARTGPVPGAAATSSSQRPVHLVMVGDGPLLEEVRREAARLGVADRVCTPGRVGPGAGARYLRAADLLCVPSHNEGLPNVLGEAYASGLRVVATRVGGIPESLSEPFLGRLIEPDDPTAMAAAFAAELAAPADTERIVAHARKFSWPETARAYAELLRAAVAGGV